MKSFHRRSRRPVTAPASPDRLPADRGGDVRMDALLVSRGCAPSRAAAQRLIEAGVVRIDGAVVAKPSRLVHPECCIAIEKTTENSRLA